ncbi:MAG: type II toxin-antitoxin system HicA family toxin [Firmicutes bacterium]|nr:type II toxin-antitoxin system HicA family toxin [Bacillota bacterium]
MADFTKQVKSILSQNGCYFVRYGKGDHEVWHSPILGKNFAIDGKIRKKTSANAYLKIAGVQHKI